MKRRQSKSSVIDSSKGIDFVILNHSMNRLYIVE